LKQHGQAASSGSKTKAPGSAGGYLLKVCWGDLGTPTHIGIYRCGAHMVHVTPGDIKPANGDPEKVFTAIHQDFFS
jgi:hypothetical protein